MTAVVVRVRLTGGDEITSSITRDAVADLGLADHTGVVVLIESTEVRWVSCDRAHHYLCRETEAE